MLYSEESSSYAHSRLATTQRLFTALADLFKSGAESKTMKSVAISLAAFISVASHVRTWPGKKFDWRAAWVCLERPFNAKSIR
jgi:hypothetical protein